MGPAKEKDRCRDAAEAPPRLASPRICMPTWRNFARKAYQCGLYEAQDVLADVADVDLIHLNKGWGARFKETSLRRPLYYDISRKLVFANPGLKTVQLRDDYDVFIAVCSTYWDLPNINAIEHWRKRSKISICWIEEIWVNEIAKYKYWHGALSQFDYVFIGLKGSVSALSQAVNRTCYWLPGGVDALRFSPFPDPPARVIDVYSIGRRYEVIHRELLKAVERGELFYVYTTHASAGNAEVTDYQQHRKLYANMAKRSHYFCVSAGKMDSFRETRGQIEIGYRYYEGAAAGAVMIGDAPDCEAYRELFGWPEAVIQIQPDGSDVMDVLSALSSDTERMVAISTRNAKEALLHHDWVYRWNEMFRIAGIEPTPRMAARERRLKNMADFAANWRPDGF